MQQSFAITLQTGPGPKSLAAATEWLRACTSATGAALDERVIIPSEDHPARRAPLTGRYDDPSIPWVGWIEDDARTWVAFVAQRPERFTLLWTERDATGGVKGAPVCFYRDPVAAESRAREKAPIAKTVQAHGATFHIDRPIGHVKKGTAPDGSAYEVTYTCDYGYLAKTHEGKEPPIGGDKMLIDAYCCAPTSRSDGGDDGPPSSVGVEPVIHVVNQVKFGTNEPDEQKLILGARDAEHATRVYFDHTPAKCFGSMFTMTGAAFRAQLAACKSGQPCSFVPGDPDDLEPPSTKRGAGVDNPTRGAIPRHAASATVHASQEPHQMPLATVTPQPAVHRDAPPGAADPSAIPELFTRLIVAERAYSKEVDGKSRVHVDFVMSTEAKDNHGTVLRAQWDLKRFNANPVFLYMHNRRADLPPIGVMQNVRVEGKKLLGTAVFDDTTEFDRAIAAKYLNGTMRGGSVGFNPRSISVEIVDDEETVIFGDNELLEFSAACVPSNPETIAQQKARCLELGRAAADETPTRGAVPHMKYPLDQSSKWDAAAAEKRVRAWATSNGKVAFGKYARAFGWVDPEKAQSFDGYKLLHHDVSPDGKSLVTVRGGVIAAGNAIQGARGGLKIPPGDLPAVKAHLAEHYREFNIKPPWEAKKTHDTAPSTTEPSMHTLVLRLADLDPNDKTRTPEAPHSVDAKCPSCNEEVRTTVELSPELVKRGADLAEARAALTETQATLAAAEARATALETKATLRGADVSALLLQIAERDLKDLIGKKIDPAEQDTEMELARVYFADETRDDKGNLVGLTKWQARVAKLTARPDMKLTQRALPAPKAGDAPTQPGAADAAKRDDKGRTVAGQSAVARIGARA